MASRQPVAQSAPANVSAAGLRTFFRIADAWGLTGEQARRLLGVPPATYQRWKRNPERARLDQDKLERLSYIFGIWKALETLLPRKEAARTWVRRPNDAPLFNGQPPLQRMLSGQVADLYEVRTWLDARRGVWT